MTVKAASAARNWARGFPRSCPIREPFRAAAQNSQAVKRTRLAREIFAVPVVAMVSTSSNIALVSRSCPLQSGIALVLSPRSIMARVLAWARWIYPCDSVQTDQLIPPACGPSFRSLSGEEPIVFSLDDRIAFAGATFELCTVEHCDMTSAVRNEPGREQSAGSFGDPLPADAQQIGDEFLRHDQFVGS